MNSSDKFAPHHTPRRVAPHFKLKTPSPKITSSTMSIDKTVIPDKLIIDNGLRELFIECTTSLEDAAKILKNSEEYVLQSNINKNTTVIDNNDNSGEEISDNDDNIEEIFDDDDTIEDISGDEEFFDDDDDDDDIEDISGDEETYDNEDDVYMKNMESEVWRQVPPEFIDGITNIEVNNYGKIRDTETLEPIETRSDFSHNRIAKYQYVTFDGNTYYLHRLVYVAFYPEILDQIKNGTVHFKNTSPGMINNGVYRTHLNDLLFSPCESKDELSKINSNLSPEKAHHPMYGEFYYYKPMPVIYHRTDKNTGKHVIEKHNNYKIILIKNNKFPCKILNSVGKELSLYYKKEHDPSVSLSKYKTSRNYLLTHVLLSSAFPEILPEFTVDHIDDNSINHDITNLQWMTRTENATKGQVKSCKTSKTGKTTLMICPETYECLKTFISIAKAAEHIKKLHGTKYKGKEGTMSNKIDRAAKSIKVTGKRKRLKAYKYYWEFADNSIEDEIWKPIQFHANYVYQISNRGRIKKIYGLITKGCPIRGRKYRTTDVIIGLDDAGRCLSQKYYTRQLVWLAFNGFLPDKASGLEILHDDNAPRDEIDSYRNWLEDLRLGTRSENNQERHKVAKTILSNK